MRAILYLERGLEVELIRIVVVGGGIVLLLLLLLVIAISFCSSTFSVALGACRRGRRRNNNVPGVVMVTAEVAQGLRRWRWRRLLLLIAAGVGAAFAMVVAFVGAAVL